MSSQTPRDRQMDPTPAGGLGSYPQWIGRVEWEQKGFDLRRDSVTVRNLHAQTSAAVDIWGRHKTQPISISVTIWPAKGFDAVAQTDQLGDSNLNYGVLSKKLRDAIDAKKDYVGSLEGFNDYLWNQMKSLTPVADKVVWSIELFLPKASVLGKGVSFTTLFGRSENMFFARDTLHVREIAIPTIVGINPHEREMKQLVVVSVWIELKELEQGISGWYGPVEQIVIKTVEEAFAKTLESLAAKIISNLFKLWVFHLGNAVDVRVKIEKPSAVIDADAAGVDMTRSSDATEKGSLAEMALDACGDREFETPEFPMMERLDDWMRRKGIS
ncbi:MAG: hypothetical protein M1823_002623 [Watsoniomyces obsoletus]|nr:MAG: hypothetical protein M1823_002623 [Watsoniomyces obsoletus]